MKCTDVQFALGADPSSTDPELHQHLQSCDSCSAYARDMQELDRLLQGAMAVPVPERELRDRKPATHLSSRLALAATLAGVAVLMGLLWIGVPRPTLAQAVVAHMAHEPDAWRSQTPLPETTVAQVLSRSGVRLTNDLREVTYLNTCWFRGHNVPHFVVQTPGGPVTIMVLRHEKVAGNVEFREGRYRGVLVPAARGSIAVLGRDATDVGPAAAQVLAAFAYVD